MPVELKPDDEKKIQSRYADLINYNSKNFDDPINPLTYRDAGGDSLLHIAAMRGDSETLSTLLRAGFDPNSRGEMNSTALHYAASNNHSDCIKILIDHGADALLKDDFGKVPNISTI